MARNPAYARAAASRSAPKPKSDEQRRREAIAHNKRYPQNQVTPPWTEEMRRKWALEQNRKFPQNQVNVDPAPSASGGGSGGAGGGAGGGAPPARVEPFWTGDQQAGYWDRYGQLAGLVGYTAPDGTYVPGSIDAELGALANDTTYQNTQLDKQQQAATTAAVDNAIARGLYQSSIKDADIFDITATAKLRKQYLNDKLNMARLEGARRKKQAGDNWTNFLSHGWLQMGVDNAARLAAEQPPPETPPPPASTPAQPPASTPAQPPAPRPPRTPAQMRQANPAMVARVKRRMLARRRG